MAKKLFKCGHKGLGQFCHRCGDADKIVEKAGKVRDPHDQRQMRVAAAKLYSTSTTSTLNAHDLVRAGFEETAAEHYARAYNDAMSDGSPVDLRAIAARVGYPS